MRWLAPLAALAALALAQNAAAAPVTLAPVSYSPEFQASLNDDLGTREGAYLSDAVTRSLTGALERAGAQVGTPGGLTVETTIIEAAPNRPTMQQLVSKPGLSEIYSISIGGAELNAVIRGADGSVLAEVHHRRFSSDIRDVIPPAIEWSDAHRAIRQFAVKVANAYRASAR